MPPRSRSAARRATPKQHPSPISDRARIELRVAPGAQRSKVVGRHGDGWRVRVAAPPEDGKANAELARLLADVLGVARSDVQVVSGASARGKLVQVDGMTFEQVAGLLDAATGK